jgi:hypothetical protein
VVEICYHFYLIQKKILDSEKNVGSVNCCQLGINYNCFNYLTL